MNVTTGDYRFLPFRFERRGKKVLLVNDVGEYYFADISDFNDFIHHKLCVRSTEFMDLKSRGMLCDDHLPQTIDLMATKYRTKKKFLYDFTSLHMFVVTLRCNQQCSYCHASSVDEMEGNCFDMDQKTARKCVEIAFKSPSKFIKIELQGGEPLLNFDTVKEIIEYAEELNELAQKEIEFVICTNLLCLNEHHLEYFKSKNVFISTSLDGPQDIHDACRKVRCGGSSYEGTIPKLNWAMKELGQDKISALMTVTPFNIEMLNKVVDEYLQQGLEAIFLRMINPFGYAHKNWSDLGYNVDTFLKGYKNALDYIIQVNLNGTYFPELLATLLLARILTPFSTGFVDLQSPAGVGISGVIYDVNGDVYVSDEARMLARVGDKKFRIGNVYNNSWNDIFNGLHLRKIIEASCIEALPGCAWCVFQPYCGGDPVRNYAIGGDMIGKRPGNDFCRKHRALFNLLFDYLELENDDLDDVFWSWITCRSIDRIHNNTTM